MNHPKPILDTISYNETAPKLVIHRSNKQGCIWTWQYHPHVEFLVVLDGEVELQIEDEKRRLTPGDGALIFPFVPHCYTYEEGISCERFMAGFDAQYYGEFRDLFMYGRTQTPFFTAEQMQTIQPLERSAYVRLCTSLDTRTALDKMRCRANFAVMLARIFPFLGVVSVERGDEALYRAATAYIAENFMNTELTVLDVAQALGVSRTKISKLFSEKHGGVKDCIVDRRIRYAEALLRNGNMSVAQVAAESGFAEVRTFNRVFKKANGVSPSLYRKKTINGIEDYFVAK